MRMASSEENLYPFKLMKSGNRKPTRNLIDTISLIITKYETCTQYTYANLPLSEKRSLSLHGIDKYPSPGLQNSLINLLNV